MANIQTFNKHCLERQGKILVKFGAPWCGPCRQMVPILDKLAEEGYNNIYDVDIDVETDLAASYGVRSVPTFILFEDGKELTRKVGTVSGLDIKDLLKDN